MDDSQAEVHKVEIHIRVLALALTSLVNVSPTDDQIVKRAEALVSFVYRHQRKEEPEIFIPAAKRGRRCVECNDPILKFQERIVLCSQRRRKPKHYHKGCYELLTEPEEREE